MKKRHELGFRTERKSENKKKVFTVTVSLERNIDEMKNSSEKIKSQIQIFNYRLIPILSLITGYFGMNSFNNLPHIYPTFILLFTIIIFTIVRWFKR